MSKEPRTLYDVPRALPLLDATRPVSCAPLAAGALDATAAAQVAVRLKALADPARVRLMSLLLASGTDGVCTCDLAPALGLSEPTVSHHLKTMRAAGLVTSERRGLNVHYLPQRDALGALCRVIDPECC